MDTLPSGDLQVMASGPPWLVSGFRFRARLGFSIPFTFLRPARHYPRIRIRRSSFERRRDFNPPEQRAAQRTIWRSPTPPERACPPYGSSPSRTGLAPSRDEASRRPPGSRACCFSTCAGSQTTQDRSAAGELTRPIVLPSPVNTGSAFLIQRFSKLDSPAHRYPCLRFDERLAAFPARLGAKMESLLLSRRTLAFPATCRFSPAHTDLRII
jgi:hypothetical protein